MAFQPKRGTTLLIPSGPQGSHLFVVLTDEVDGEYLLVSVSSIKEGRYHDPTCEIPAGVHEFIKQESYAFYGGARVDLASRLVRLEAQGYFFAKDDMPAHVVDAICNGIQLSDHTPRHAINFFRKWRGL